jgi:DNA-directed RNA polymerase specialized sigma24 family protein
MSSPADLLAHPEVVELISRILRRFRVPSQDLKDGVADVQRRILYSLRNKPLFVWPKDLAEWKRLAVRGTKHELIDRARKAKRRKELGDEGLQVPEPDAAVAEGRRPSERHAIDHARAMKLIEQLLAENPNGETWRKILDGLCDDKDQAEIAKELGLSHQKVRDETRTMRARFHQKVAVALGTGALIAAVALMPRNENVGKGRPETEHPATSAPAKPPLTPEQTRHVAELRATGHARALEKDWAHCFAAYLEAERMDPESVPQEAKEEADMCKRELDETDAAPGIP